MIFRKSQKPKAFTPKVTSIPQWTHWNIKLSTLQRAQALGHNGGENGRQDIRNDDY